MQRPDQRGPVPVFIVGPNVHVAERWARDRALPQGTWRAVTRSFDAERLRGHAYGHGIVVVLNGSWRNRAATEALQVARHRGFVVAYENDLCEHRPPCVDADPVTCFKPEYVAQISRSLALAVFNVEGLAAQHPGLMARIREHRDAEAAELEPSA